LSDAGLLRVHRTKSQAKSGPRFTARRTAKAAAITAYPARCRGSQGLHKATQNAERLGLGDLWTITASPSAPTEASPWTSTTSEPRRSSRSSSAPTCHTRAFRPPPHSRHAAALPWPPCQTRPGASRSLVGSHDTRPLQPRPPRHERPDRRRDGGRPVLKPDLLTTNPATHSESWGGRKNVSKATRTS
jgi:hypothetical protein